MAKYQYVGNGQGVPGLPAEITDKQAKEMGVEDLLQAALKAGTFEEVKAKKKASK